MFLRRLIKVTLSDGSDRSDEVQIRVRKRDGIMGYPVVPVVMLSVQVTVVPLNIVTTRNGTKNTNETSCGTTVAFSCEECYEMKGDKQLSCFPNRTWSGEEPICSRQYLINSSFSQCFSLQTPYVFTCLCSNVLPRSCASSTWK